MAQLFHLSGQTLVDGSGVPYALAKAYFYETGTTTPKSTFSNAGLTSANTNPVVADANGRFGDIYLIAGRYKVVYATSADVAIDTLDPVDGTSQLITAASAPGTTYPFLRYYNTTDGRVYRRNAANSAWIDEGLVDSLISGATVSEVLTGTATDKATTPDAIAGLWQRGTDIASASTLSLPAGGGGVFNVTGTTGITAISSAQGGRSVKLRFAGALTITHNATSMILPGGANITTVAGDTGEWINEAAADGSGSNWRCFSFETGDGRILPAAAAFATQAQQETATSTSVAVSPGRQQFHPSAPKAWVSFVTRGTDGACTISSSYNVTGVSRSGAGTYIVTFTTAMSSATYVAVGTVQTTIGSNILVTSGSLATGTCNILTQSASAGTAQDVGTVHVIFMGDQ